MQNYYNLIMEALGNGSPKECHNNLMDILQKRLANESSINHLYDKKQRKIAVDFLTWYKNQSSTENAEISFEDFVSQYTFQS